MKKTNIITLRLNETYQNELNNIIKIKKEIYKNNKFTIADFLKEAIDDFEELNDETYKNKYEKLKFELMSSINNELNSIKENQKIILNYLKKIKKEEENFDEKFLNKNLKVDYD